MATVRLYLDKRSVKNGTMHVKMMVSHKSSSQLITLGIRIEERQWDKVNGRIINHPKKAVLNGILQKKLADAELAMVEFADSHGMKDVTALDLKKVVLGEYDEGKKNDKPTFREWFIRCIEKRTGRTSASFVSALHKVEAFDPNMDKLHFEDINKDWLERFNVFMKECNSSNTRWIYFAKIKAVFNDAIDNDITTHYPFRKFTIRRAATRKRSLTVEQLRELFNCDVVPSHRIALDMFKLIFFLCGINFKDLFGLKSVQNGRVEYRRAKTGRLYSIKVEPEAMEIIERYKGENALLSLADKRNDSIMALRSVNDLLRRVGPRPSTKPPKKRGKMTEPLFPELTTYWARHSWATIAASLDIPKETISAGLGHSLGSSITDIYIDFDQRKVDDANRKIIDWVLYGKR